MVEKMKIAIVGCGRILKKHLEAIQEEPRLTLVAVCDVVEEKAQKTGEEQNVPYYTDLTEMLASQTDIDIVSVLTPSHDHPVSTITALKHKKHVIVEKPMALDLKDADTMIRTADENGVKLFVVKQNRFNKAIQKTREAYEQGRFGKLSLGTVRVRWRRDQHYYDQDEWRGTWWGDGGAITNQASHHIDLLQWMFGDVHSVMCKTATQLVDIESEDTAVGILQFENGALGVVEATTATRPINLEGSLSILGEGGTVVVGGFAVNTIDTWAFTEEHEDDATVRETYKEAPPSVYGFGHIQYYKHVMDAIVNGTKSLIDGFEGRKSIEIINALYESAETGQEVHLRFHTKESKLGRPR